MTVKNKNLLSVIKLWSPPAISHDGLIENQGQRSLQVVIDLAKSWSPSRLLLTLTLSSRTLAALMTFFCWSLNSNPGIRELPLELGQLSNLWQLEIDDLSITNVPKGVQVEGTVYSLCWRSCLSWCGKKTCCLGSYMHFESEPSAAQPSWRVYMLYNLLRTIT